VATGRSAAHRHGCTSWSRPDLGRSRHPATDALDILAVWEPAGLVALEAIVAPGRLEMLDRSGLLAVRADRRRQQVTLAHPLYGEILRARMSALTRRRLLLEHADRIDALGARRREDAIRVATARLEASGTSDPALLLRAARLARYGHDFTQVERLGRAAMVDGITAEAGLLVGEALHEHHAFVEADEVLTAAEAVAVDDELLVFIVEMLARNHMWGLFQNDEALRVNARALDRLRDPHCIQEIRLHEAFLLTYSGRPADALAALAPHGDLPTLRLRALRALAEVPAFIAVGKCETAVFEAQHAFVEQIELPDPVALPGPGVHVIHQIYGLTECGRFQEATTLATYAYEATPANALPDGLMAQPSVGLALPDGPPKRRGLARRGRAVRGEQHPG
jgi:hypothetical protein